MDRRTGNLVNDPTLGRSNNEIIQGPMGHGNAVLFWSFLGQASDFCLLFRRDRMSSTPSFRIGEPLKDEACVHLGTQIRIALFPVLMFLCPAFSPFADGVTTETGQWNDVLILQPSGGGKHRLHSLFLEI